MRLKSAVVCSTVALTLAAGAASAQAAVIGPVRPLPVLPPTCPAGEQAVWVDQAATIGELYIDPYTGQLKWIGGQPEFHGWQCQPITLVPVGP